jgi:hypothetical protein
MNSRNKFFLFWTIAGFLVVGMELTSCILKLDVVCRSEKQEGHEGQFRMKYKYFDAGFPWRLNWNALYGRTMINIWGAGMR